MSNDLQVKRVIGRRDERLKASKQLKEGTAATTSNKSKKPDELEATRHIPQMPSQMFGQANEALVPPYNVLLDTNFFAHTVRAKIDLLPGLMDAVLAKCNPVITECTIAELEKLGQKYRLALRLAKDERWKVLKCSHTGTYADDCIVDTCMKHRIYLVGTNDKNLRTRLRRIPGVPLIAVGRGKYSVERLTGGVV